MPGNRRATNWKILSKFQLVFDKTAVIVQAIAEIEGKVLFNPGFTGDISPSAFLI